jgi:hypothetical protein
MCIYILVTTEISAATSSQTERLTTMHGQKTSSMPMKPNTASMTQHFDSIAYVTANPGQLNAEQAAGRSAASVRQFKLGFGNLMD